MELNIHNVTKVSALPIDNFSTFVTRKFLFESEDGEKLTVIAFGKTSEEVSLSVVTNQKV